MRITNVGTKIIHKPSTQEILYCLGSMPSFSKILLKENQSKPYSAFLNWLISNDYFETLNEKTTIKKLSADFGIETVKATKWIKDIYDQILELNLDKPELFQNSGIKLYFDFKNYDNYCNLYLTLPVLPRIYESIRFPFVKAKLGIDYFWVKNVEHEITVDNALICLSLEGGFVNRYREFAIDKALFQGWIHFMDVYDLPSFKLDEEINKIYRT